MKYFVLSILIVVNAHALRLDCILKSYSSSPLGKELARADTLTKTIQKKYQGRSISFEEAVGEVLAILPDDLKTKYSKYLKGVNVVEGDPWSFDANRIVYGSRLRHPLSPNDISHAKVHWSSKPIVNSDQVDEVIERTIDILTEAEFSPIRRVAIYTKGRANFITKNAEAIADRVYMKLLYGIESGHEFEKGGLGSELLHFADTMKRAFISRKYGPIDGIRLTSFHQKLLEDKGPLALYRYLRRTESESLALKYYLRHMENLQYIAVATVIPLVAPRIYESYYYFKTQETINFDNEEDAVIAVKAIQNLRKDPIEMVEEIKELLPKLEAPEEDKKEFLDLLHALEQEEEENKQKLLMDK